MINVAYRCVACLWLIFAIHKKKYYQLAYCVMYRFDFPYSF